MYPTLNRRAGTAPERWCSFQKRRVKKGTDRDEARNPVSFKASQNPNTAFRQGFPRSKSERTGTHAKQPPHVGTAEPNGMLHNAPWGYKTLQFTPWTTQASTSSGFERPTVDGNELVSRTNS